LKKGEITITITIGLVVLILTAVIFVQFKTINQTDITALENMREDELKTEISNFKKKLEEITAEVKGVESKTKEYQKAVDSNQEASKLLEQELEEQNNLLGKNSVKGNGILITLTDTNNQKISSEDLRALLNELRLAGAEAISINGQRIVYDSYVVDIGGTYISVNGQRIVSPYEVKAIGDPTYLESGLSKKQFGYIDTKTGEGKDVSLKRQNNITIDKYDGDLNMEYAN